MKEVNAKYYLVVANIVSISIEQWEVLIPKKDWETLLLGEKKISGYGQIGDVFYD